MIGSISVIPVGIVLSSVATPVDDIWGGLVSRIDLDTSRFTPDSLAGLDAFSHVEIIFAFHQVPESKIETTARHPRNRTDWPKVGIFAQRGKNRPNRIGVTICKLKSVDGTSLSVEGLDAIDGTPVLDIKPYMREFAPREETRQPAWSTELMAAYWNSAG
ncbi:MAG TPA: SAM-dependent methyltransferase [Bryobacteraceae bacterium]|nr:SAM-dependent methyltransferase [Bryobacteraceae bacterium]